MYFAWAYFVWARFENSFLETNKKNSWTSLEKTNNRTRKASLTEVQNFVLIENAGVGAYNRIGQDAQVIRIVWRVLIAWYEAAHAYLAEIGRVF